MRKRISRSTVSHQQDTRGKHLTEQMVTRSGKKAHTCSSGSDQREPCARRESWRRESKRSAKSVKRTSMERRQRESGRREGDGTRDTERQRSERSGTRRVEGRAKSRNTVCAQSGSEWRRLAAGAVSLRECCGRASERVSEGSRRERGSAAAPASLTDCRQTSREHLIPSLSPFVVVVVQLLHRVCSCCCCCC